MGRFALALVVGVVSGMTATAVCSAGCGFSGNLNVVDSSGLTAVQDRADLVTIGDLTHVVFTDWRNGPPQVQYVRLRADDTVEAAFALGQPAYLGSFDARIACDPTLPNHLYVIYTAQYTSYPNPQIICRHSSNGGLSWGVEVGVNTGFPSSGRDLGTPDVAVLLNHTVVAVWTDFTNSYDHEVFGSTSASFGSAWTPNSSILSDPSVHDAEPRVAGDEAGGVYVVFLHSQSALAPFNRRPRLAYSSSSGASYSLRADLDPVGAMGTDDHAVDLVVWGSGALAVAWDGVRQGSTEHRIYYQASLDGGLSWTTGTDAVVFGLPDPSRADYDPRLAADGAGGLTCVFNTVFSTDSGIGHAADNVFGSSTSSTCRIDVSGLGDGLAAAPAIDRSAGGRVAVVWSDAREGIQHVYYDEISPSLYESFEDPAFSEWAVAQSVQIDFTRSVDFNGSSARMGDTTPGRAAGLLEHVWPAKQMGSLSFWFWDGIGTDPAYLASDWTASLAYEDGGRAGAAEDGGRAGVVRTLGVVNPSSTTHYSVSTDGGGSWQVTQVPRATGWHQIVFEVNQDDGLIATIDAIAYPNPPENPVIEDSGFLKFETLTFEGGTGSAPYGVDELNCVTEDAPGMVPALSLAGLGLLAAGLTCLLARGRRRPL